MDDHGAPEGEDLQGLLGSKEGVRHLLKGCGNCLEAARQGRVSRAAARGEALSPELAAAYETSLEHAEEFGRRAAALSLREKVRFKKALSLLRSKEGVRALTGAGMFVRGEGVYEALLLQSWMLRYDDPQHMCHLARVAVEMCDSFDPEVYGAQRVVDLRARAWGELGNAYRVANRYREAEEAFGNAFSFLLKGSGDRALRMRLLDLEASLLGTLRNFELALERMTILSRMYREDGNLHLAGRTLITKALYTYYQGDTDAACQTIEEGLSLIDRNLDPSLVLVAAFDQLLFLVDAGRYSEAKGVLFENRPGFTDQGRIAMVKLRGIEGCINYGLGKLESAEVAFREAKAAFAEAEMSFGCAWASLELAMTLLRQGRTDEAIKEGLESAAMFLTLDIQREILGTAMFLQDAFEKGTVELATLETTVRWLSKKMVEYGVS
jgi:tetratricopeptide (TPR) repeat protein